MSGIAIQYGSRLTGNLDRLATVSILYFMALSVRKPYENRGSRFSSSKWLAGGMTIEEVLADYADLERDEILAALAYAVRFAHVNRAEPLTV